MKGGSAVFLNVEGGGDPWVKGCDAGLTFGALPGLLGCTTAESGLLGGHGGESE